MKSHVDQLAEVLEGMAHARELAALKTTKRMLAGPRHLYPMSMVASQLTINPFEFMILIALFITGVSYFIAGVAVPGSIQSLLPPLWARVWTVNLAVGSLSALVGGLWRRDPDRGLLIYQFGWGLCGIGTAIYGFAVLLRFPSTGLYPGLTNVLFAAAALTRVYQIQRFFKIADLLRLGLLTLPYFVPPPRIPPPQVPPPGGERSDLDPGGA